jgi:hypothetical protein
MVTASPMQEAADRLRRLQGRLEQILVSGWQHAHDDLGAITAEADALSAYGLDSPAERVRRVATASDAGEALAAVSLAVATCRLLQVRIAADARPEGDWAALRPTGRRTQPARERFMPISRIVVEATEVWACVRLHGGLAAGLHLLELPAGVTTPAESATPNRDTSAPWLQWQVEGSPRWRARYRWGSEKEIDHCALVDVEWQQTLELEVGLPTILDQAIDTAKSGQQGAIVRGNVPVRAQLLDENAIKDCLWLDPSHPDLFRASAHETSWALVWSQAGTVTPLAAIRPGQRSRPAAMLHFVPGEQSVPDNTNEPGKRGWSLTRFLPRRPASS